MHALGTSAGTDLRLIAPPTGAELGSLSSVRDTFTRTDPAHTWVTIGC
ncbi:hypothetical protein AB0I68_31040 [Streptomyces sp. NPDC050448]